jgi:hypothetical protein
MREFEREYGVHIIPYGFDLRGFWKPEFTYLLTAMYLGDLVSFFLYTLYIPIDIRLSPVLRRRDLQRSAARTIGFSGHHHASTYRHLIFWDHGFEGILRRWKG